MGTHVPEVFRLSGWDPSTTNAALQLTADKPYCALHTSRVTIVGKDLYIDGGQLETQTVTASGTTEKQSHSNTRLLSVDLSQSFSWNRPPVITYPKGSDVPSTNWGALFSAKDRFYSFGGLYPGGNITQTTTNGAILWSYSRSTGWVKETSTGDTVLDAWNGGDTSDTTEGVGYYIGGQVNTWSSPGTVIAYQRLLLSLRGNKWTRENLPDRLAYIQHPFLEYLPLGKKGILVNMGGVKMDGEKVPDAGAELKSMSDIEIYDIDSRRWFTQTASGGRDGVPFPRHRGCSAVFAAPDRSSYTIYVYGGLTGLGDMDGLSGDTEVWALSLPSFTWVKIDAGDNHTIRRHTCVSHGKYMLSVAGIVSLTRTPDTYLCRELIKVLDTTTGKWLKETEQVDANAAFQVPESIIAEIGGDAQGGATKTDPEADWGPGVEAIFYPNGRSPAGVNSISSIDPPATVSSAVGDSATGHNNNNNGTTAASTQLSGGAIAGIAVGSFAGVAIIVGGLLFLFLRRRRRRAQRKAQAVEIEKNGPRELGGNGIQGMAAQQENYTALKSDIAVYEVPGAQAQVHEMPSYPVELEGAVAYGREHKLTSG